MRKRNIGRLTIFCGSICLALAGPAVTLADDDQLQEVVVTAQKRSENAQNVGIALAAYSAEDLKTAGVTNLTDLARFTPGLGLSGAFANQDTSISIRGVTQQDFNAISESPNAVYIDEGYIGINNISAVGLFDLDHVEVLKGPQGTLYGRNATGGVLNILTGNPSATFGGYSEYTYGSYNTNRFEGAITGPLGSDDVTGRLAVLYDHNGAYITNLAPTGGDLGGMTDWGLRGKLDVKATDNLDLLLTGFITRWTGSWGAYLSLPYTPVYAGTGPLLRQVNSVPAPTSLLWPTNTSDPASLTLNAHDAQSSGDFQNMEGGNARVTYDAAGWTLTSISDYKHFDSRLLLDNTALPVSFFDTDDNVRFQSFSQELRAYRDFKFLRLTAGMYYLNMHTNMDPNVQIIEAALGGPSYFQGTAALNTNAYAAFSQAEWDFAPQWTLVGGLRYTNDQKHYRYVQNVCPNSDPCQNVFYPAQDLSRNDGLVTGKAELEFHLREGALLYASYNRGAKSGGFNFPLGSTPPTTQPPATLPYKPESIDAYEAGFKTDWLNHTLQVNGEGYYYDYHDFQSFILLPPLTTYIRNNPAKTRGAELSVNAKPFKGFTTSLTADYLDNKVYQVNIATLSGLPFYYTKEAPFTSPWQATGIVRYEFPIFTGSLAVQADAKFIDTYFFSLTNYDSTRQPHYTLYDANVTWTSQDAHWSLSFMGTNLTDVRYKTVGFDIAALFGEEQVAYGQPRWFKGQVAYHF